MLRKFQPFSLSTSLMLWHFWSFYGKRKLLSRKIRWTVERSKPNCIDAARIAKKRLFWNNFVTSSVDHKLADSLPFPPQWSTFPDYINFCPSWEYQRGTAQIFEWHEEPISALMLQTLFGDIQKDFLSFLEFWKALVNSWNWPKAVL